MAGALSLLGHRSVKTTLVYIYVLSREGRCVLIPPGLL